METPIISVVGNIGAGKTTFLNDFIKKIAKIGDKEVVIVCEPVDKWTKRNKKEDGTEEESILELYYKDSKRYGFSFQMYALQTRFAQLREMMEIHKGKILIYERCPISDYNIFAKLLHENQTITSQEFNIYKEWFDMTYDIIKPNIRGIIYLDIPISVCATRIVKRNRNGEGNISLEYLNSLERMHDRWLNCETSSNPPVYKAEFVHGDYDQIDFDKIESFLQKVCD